MVVLTGAVFLFVPDRPSFLFQTSFFLVFTTVIVYRYLHRVANPEDFVRLYLGMIVLKLIACLGYAVVIVMEDKAGAAGNVTFFLVVYVLLTGLEVGFLYRKRGE
jgi:hypothetical protein